MLRNSGPWKARAEKSSHLSPDPPGGKGVWSWLGLALAPGLRQEAGPCGWDATPQWPGPPYQDPPPMHRCHSRTIILCCWFER